MNLVRFTLLAVACVALSAAAPRASTPPVSSARDVVDDGFDWCTVGDPGNIKFEGFFGTFVGRGSVSYQYQITRTEVKVSEYLEFVKAYWPYFDGDPRSIKLTGDFIYGYRRGNRYEYEITPGWEKAPANMSLRLAARFCNWLHNGKVNEKWVFESGVYDAGTFARNPDGSYNDDYTRSPKARYWIPNVDEWIKAVYYDPNRYGPGLGGWWHYPGCRDDCLIVDLPADGGETNGSLYRPPESPLLPAMMYPDIRSPWGLLDTSGGMCEHTEDRFALGSTYYDAIPEFVCMGDRAGTYHHLTRNGMAEFPSLTGLRLAKH